MPGKSFPRRERKKLKKGEGKKPTLTPNSTTPPVEVVPRSKTAKEPKE